MLNSTAERESCPHGRTWGDFPLRADNGQNVTLTQTHQRPTTRVNGGPPLVKVFHPSVAEFLTCADAFDFSLEITFEIGVLADSISLVLVLCKTFGDLG